MAELPDTKDALLSGDISMAQAAEIAQAEHDHPGAERELLPETRKSDLARTKQNTRDYKQAHTPVEELHAEQMAARHFRHWRDRLGMVCFEGSLPPQAGLPFMARLEQAALTLRRASRAAAEPRQAFPQYLADALAQLTGPEAKVSARTELIIVCDLDAWRRGFALPGENCHIIGGGPIPVELARELAKDAFLKAVLYKGVAIHTVAHFGRHYPAHLQTALDIGAPPDFQGRICTGCGRRYALQTDHIDPVAHHGPTKYDNLQSLCWDCHARKTEEDRKAGLLGPHARARPPNPSR
jgi:hypothetical protein